MRVNNFKVKFRYPDGVTSECTIEKGTEVITTSSVKRWHKDVPCKKTGRKYAFKAAMSAETTMNMLTKVERGAIWDQYRGTIREPKLIQH